MGMFDEFVGCIVKVVFTDGVYDEAKYKYKVARGILESYEQDILKVRGSRGVMCIHSRAIIKVIHSTKM